MSEPAFILFVELHKAAGWVRAIQAAGFKPLLIGRESSSPTGLKAIATALRQNVPFDDCDVRVHGPGEVDKILDQGRRWARDYHVAGGLLASESLVTAGAALFDELGLRYPGSVACHVSRNKALQRSEFTEISPEYYLVTPHTREIPDNVRYPVVVKPVARESSEGVVVAYGPSDTAAALDSSFNVGQYVLVEQRVSGKEYSVEYVLQDKLIMARFATEKETNEVSTRHFVETGHTSPPVALSTDDRNTLWEAADLICKRTGFETGMLHAEFRITDEGPILMEFAVRPPGDAIIPLHRMAYGLDLERLLVSACVGEAHPLPLLEPSRRARQVYSQPANGPLTRSTFQATVPVEPVWLVDTCGVWPDLGTSLTRLAGTRICLDRVLALMPEESEAGPLESSSDRQISVTFTDCLDSDQKDSTSIVNEAIFS